MARGLAMSTRIIGLNAVVRDLQALGVDVEDLKDAFSDIAREGAIQVARYTPKLTGRLAANVRGNRSKNKAVVTAGSASLPYASVINYGWAAHNIEAAHYLQKGDDAVQPYALRRIESDINEAIRRRGLR